ncbi:MAG: hypothetical protein MJZ81_09560 [Bacteroidales bacterium]|nr:hypothetical protein [Bacteroidales bacterium]
MNYYSYLKKIHTITMDGESDVPVEKCRAQGGPSSCSVHGPMLKSELSKEDSETPSTVSSEEDAAYMDAVKHGDMETAKRMVRQLAGKVFKDSIIRDSEGDMVEMFHGSSQKWNVFKDNDGAFGRGVYFTSAFPEAADYAREKMDDPNMSEDEAEDYVTSAYINVTNPDDLSNSKYGYADFSWCEETGFGDYSPNLQAVVESTQIKSSDPVTYDDDGKVIPLSKRFDMTNPDIRY